MRTRAGAVLALVLSAALVSGCGQEQQVSASASSLLTTDVAQLKTAAVSGTSADVARAAERLRSDVATQQAKGELSSDRAAAILDQLARVLADTAARPSPSPSPTRSKGDDDDGKGKGKGGERRD